MRQLPHGYLWTTHAVLFQILLHFDIMERRSFLKKASAGLGIAALSAEPETRPTQIIKDRTGDIWRNVRSDFLLDPGVYHFNSGTLGATPKPVVEAISNYLYELEGNPAARMYGEGSQLMDDVRAKLADFIGATKGELAFTRNTTEGMNAIADGLGLQAGDQILTTNHEHGGGMVCWQNLRKKHGVDIRYVTMPRLVESPEQLVNLVTSGITPRTKVCSLSHIDTIAGVRMPIEGIAPIMRARGITMVCDGAQAVGQIRVDVKSLGVDAYAFSSHKWLLGPKGSGALFIRQEMQDRITPTLLYSGYGSYSASSGTRNAAHMVGQGVAVDFHQQIGVNVVEDRCRELSMYLRGRLERVPELTIMTPTDPSLSCGIVTAALNKGRNSEIVGRMKSENNVVLKSAQGTYAYCSEEGLDKQNYNAIRFSTHIFNDPEQIDHVVTKLIETLHTS